LPSSVICGDAVIPFFSFSFFANRAPGSPPLYTLPIRSTSPIHRSQGLRFDDLRVCFRRVRRFFLIPRLPPCCPFFWAQRQNRLLPPPFFLIFATIACSTAIRCGRFSSPAGSSFFFIKRNLSLFLPSRTPFFPHEVFSLSSSSPPIAPHFR